MLVGLGLTPEAIETNPVMYDLMMENTWRAAGIVDVAEWLGAYVGRRYAGFIPAPGLWSRRTAVLSACSI